MNHVEFALQLGCLPELAAGEETVVVDGGEYPADPLESEEGADLVDLPFEVVELELHRAHLSLLRRLVDGLHDGTHSILVVGVFSVVPVEEANSLLGLAFGAPVLDEAAHFGDVEELHVVDMPVGLLLEDDGGGETGVAHGLGEGGVVLAVALDLVADLWGW